MVNSDFNAEYTQRLRLGDPETERHFITTFSALLLIKLRRRVRSATLIEEIRQETFLRAFRAIRSNDESRTPHNLGAFVNGICENTMRELMRSDTKSRPIEDDPDLRADNKAPGPENELINNERKEMVRSTLDRLPQRDQIVLRAVFLEERDKDDVCQELGVDRGHLRVLVHRAKAQFRTLLLQREPAGI